MMHQSDEQCACFLRKFLLSSLIVLLSATGVCAFDESYEKAMTFVGKHDYRRAIPHLEEYVGRTPDPAAYYLLGYSCYQLREYARSREWFDQAYLIDPEFSSDRIPAHAGLLQDDELLLLDVLTLSGLGDRLTSFAELVLGSVGQIKAAMSDDKAKQDVRSMVSDAFRPERLYPPAVAALGAQFDRTHVAASIGWFRTPLGRRMRELGGGGTVRNSASFAGAYAALPAARKQLLQELDRAQHATDLQVDAISRSLYEMLKGMQSQLGEMSMLGSAEIDALVDQMRNAPRDELTQSMLDSLAWRFRALGDEELRSAIGFYRSPAGIWFTDATRAAVQQAIGKASRETGERIGKAVLLKRFAV